jgi:hypothetical protein
MSALDFISSVESGHRLFKGTTDACKEFAANHAGKDLVWANKKSGYPGYCAYPIPDRSTPRYEILDSGAVDIKEETPNSQISDMVFELVNALKFAGATSVSIHITLSDLNDEPIEEGAE